MSNKPKKDAVKNGPLPEGLTLATAAEALHVGVTTIRRRVREGKIPVVRIGGVSRTIRIPRAWLEKVLAGGKA